MSDEFVGRVAELARSNELLQAALFGRGQLLLVAGEAGIGKTLLADRVARMAEDRGFRVAWGRCWEAGGAPPYWPWSQVFRALRADDPFTETPDASIGANEVRFRQFDTARQRLEHMATEAPLVAVLDDLHAADLPSLYLLHFIARALPSTRIVLLGTFRDAEARLAGDTGVLLSKIGREGELRRLGRLERSDVVAWVQRAAPGTSDDVAGRVHAVTEGNPLFVREVLRIGGSLDARQLPDTLRATLAEHLVRMSADARALCSVGAVLGRELDVRDVTELSELDRDTVEKYLGEASETGIVEPIPGSAERYAFTHVLLRDRLYAELAPSKRAALHWRAGTRLASADLATAAHHMLEARALAPFAEVAAVVRDAAQNAMARLAFEEAASLAARALDGPGASFEAHPELTCDLELVRAEALIRAGDVGRGREHCLRAASFASQAGSAALHARAALAYGTELASSTIEPTMVRLLREALEALRAAEQTPVHEALCARTMARLAVALTPPQCNEDLELIDGLARDALSLAKRLDDPDTLLFVAYFAMNATAGAGYQLSPAERHATISLVVELATELDRRVVLVNAAPRWITSLRESGAVTEAKIGLDAYAARVRELPRPHYQWRVPLVRATMAMLDGQLDEAERLGREALAIAETGGVPGGAVGWATHRVALAQLSGDASSIAPYAERIIATLAPIPSLAFLVSWVLAATGRISEARERLTAEKRERFSAPALNGAGETAVLLGDRALAERILPLLAEHAREAPIFWGSPHGSAAFGPAPRVLGALAALLDRRADARRFYEQGIALGERMAAATFIAQAERGLAALGAAPRARSVATPPREHAITLVRDGNVWTLTSFTGVTVRLEDAKGVQYLERLVAAPGRDIHVTELVGIEERAGDAGPLLDARAKQLYKQRLEVLKEQLAEAEAFRDSGRAERARSEIDAIADELARATGLGRRDRRAGSLAERARINVQRRIRHVIRQVEKQDAALARYLEATLRTGPFCTFKPL